MFGMAWHPGTEDACDDLGHHHFRQVLQLLDLHESREVGGNGCYTAVQQKKWMLYPLVNMQKAIENGQHGDLVRGFSR